MRAATVADGQIVVADRPRPEPGDAEVLVRVHGAGLNRADLDAAARPLPRAAGDPGRHPRARVRGRRRGVRRRRHRRWSPARAVFGIVGGGAQAEYVRVPAAHCAPVPTGLDLVTMGGVPEAYVTAHDALGDARATCAPGEWVLDPRGRERRRHGRPATRAGVRRARRRDRPHGRQARRCRALGLARRDPGGVARRRARRRRARRGDRRRNRRRRRRRARPRRRQLRRGRHRGRVAQGPDRAHRRARRRSRASSTSSP